jgi:predicted AlkP superfamily pyrophosphatase or phosphodiesterase
LTQLSMTRAAAQFLALAAVAIPLCLTTGPATAQNNRQSDVFSDRVQQHQRPHLTVVISIDQFRADYLRRLTDLYLPAKQKDGKVGGFRYLMSQGAYYIDARYNHYPTYTGPGHAVILTGGYPYKTGIVANDWFDKANRASVYCVDDARQKVVGAASNSTAKPMGPLNLRSTTLGDELKLATGGAAKVITLSLKDRAAILLGGHAQDTSIWYDDAGGRWISSTAYCKDGKLPAWVEAVNAQGIPDKSLGTTWTPSVSPEAMVRTISPNLPPKNEPYGMGLTFPHKVGTEKNKQNYRAFTLTPGANAYVLNTAKQAVLAEKLGQRGDTPDLLAINLATNDYVGHAFGPYSPEALDTAVQTDHQIADFLDFLGKTVSGGLKEVVFVITADHGVVPNVENLQERHITAGRVLESDISNTVQEALSKTFGGGEWIGKGADGKLVGAYVEPNIYLNEIAIKEVLASGKASSRSQIEDIAARAVAALPGIYSCYTRSQITEGRLPQNEITRRVVNGFYPKVSGDLIVVSEALYYTDPGTPGPYITTHGSPYAYDTHVPILIAGPGIKAGVHPEQVSPADIAPTLSALLGVELPSACDGVILPSVFILR